MIDVRWKLKKFLYDNKVYQKDLANAIGVSEATISYMVKGRFDPNEKRLKQIADYLKISRAELDKLMDNKTA